MNFFLINYPKGLILSNAEHLQAPTGRFIPRAALGISSLHWPWQFVLQVVIYG